MEKVRWWVPSITTCNIWGQFRCSFENSIRHACILTWLRTLGLNLDFDRLNSNLQSSKFCLCYWTRELQSNWRRHCHLFFHINSPFCEPVGLVKTLRWNSASDLFNSETFNSVDVVFLLNLIMNTDGNQGTITQVQKISTTVKV